MAGLTDAEREKFSKLSNDDLIEMFAAMRDERDKLNEKYTKERKRFIEDALKADRDDDHTETKSEREGEPRELSKNTAFQRLKKKIF